MSESCAAKVLHEDAGFRVRMQPFDKNEQACVFHFHQYCISSFDHKSFAAHIWVICKSDLSITILCILSVYLLHFKFSLTNLYTNNVFVIPNDGLVRFEGKQYVFTQADKNKYQMEEVATQNNENGFTQIIFADSSNVRGKIFVIKGAYTLLMKMKNIEEE